MSSDENFDVAPTIFKVGYMFDSTFIVSCDISVFNDEFRYFPPSRKMFKLFFDAKLHMSYIRSDPLKVFPKYSLSKNEKVPIFKPNRAAFIGNKILLFIFFTSLKYL